jgi:HEAT repeat protein
MMEPVLTHNTFALKDRSSVLGAMGRTSVEGDCLTRRYLVPIIRMAASFAPDDFFSFDFLEEWFEVLGRLGVGARLAIPRLREFRDHHNPWVRMWATEALKKISSEKS